MCFARDPLLVVPRSVALKDLRLEQPHKRQVAVFLPVVQAIPYHEPVRQLEAHILQRQIDEAMLALIEEGTPVVAICPDDNTLYETMGNTIEARARGAFIIGVSDIKDELYDFWLEIPRVGKLFYPLVSIVPLHLLAYYIAIKAGRDPDKPRNLAKSVTVK